MMPAIRFTCRPRCLLPLLVLSLPLSVSVQRAFAQQDAARADSLLAAGAALAQEGAFAQAEPALREVLALREAALGSDAPATLDAATELGWLLFDLGRPDETVPLFERVAAARETAADALAHADALSDLAFVRYQTGQYDGAYVAAERALSLYETELAPDDERLAYPLNTLALLRFGAGDLTEAQRLYERVLGIVQATHGTDHPDVAVVMINLAPVVQQQGNLAEARQLYERALAIDRTAFGDDHPAVANDLDRLAYLLAEQGDYTAARERYEEAIAIYEAVFGPDDHRLAGTLHNLADVLARLGERGAARELLERALALTEAGRGPEHPEVARALRSLALLALDRDEPETALTLFERALRVQTAAFGEAQPAVAQTTADLGRAAAAAGRFDQADSLFARALATWEATLGPDHPRVAWGLNERALAALQSGADDATVYPAIRRAGQIVDAYAARGLPALAFAEQRAFVDTVVPRQTALLLSTTGAAIAEDYGLLLRWKGLLLHALRRHAAVARLGDHPEHAAAVAELGALRGDLAAWYVRADRMDPAVWRIRNDSLTQRKEALERTLAQALPERALEDPLADLDADTFGALLPPHSAFVDVYRYRRYEAGYPAEARYAAVVTAPGQAAVLVDLGAANTADEAAERWRRAVLGGAPGTHELEALRQQAWAPVAAVLSPETEQVWVSPDGQLVRLPWNVLAEADLSTQHLAVAHVDAARVLVPLLRTAPTSSEGGVLLVGGVDFGTGEAGLWEPLPGTTSEVTALTTLAEAAQLPAEVLTGAQPTPESVAEALQDARYAHLATHGFFFGESETAYASRGVTTVTPTGIATRNPLVESGLALADANASPAGSLTAEELVGLDLSGTRLITLSACDTGRGAEVTGQGVMGLRASIGAAGARTLLMSLWKVPDASTALLMEAFYRGLWTEGLAPAEALRQAQAEVRARSEYAAPVHWAAWVLSGDAR